MVRGLLVLLLLDAGAWALPADGDGAGVTEVSPRSESDPGIHLTMTPEEMYKVMYVEPNQTKAANLTVTNLADKNDTVFLKLSVDFRGHPGGVGAGYNGTGWNVLLEGEAFELECHHTRKVTVGVRAPKTGLPSDYIIVRVNSTSTLDPACCRNVSFRSYLTYCQYFSLKCADKMHQASWGGTTYSIEVKNNGPMEENVTLTVNGPPGWDCYLDRYNVTVLGLESEFVTLTVIPPWDNECDEIGTVTVLARDVRNYSIKDQITTHTLTYGGLWMELISAEPEAFLNPGETHIFPLYIFNCMNIAGSVNLTLSINLNSPGWRATLSTEMVTVAGGETMEVNLTVTAPPDALAGSRLIVRVLGSTSEPRMSVDSLVTAIVKQVHAVGVMSRPQPVELQPGGTAACDITVHNDGNGDEKLRPEIPAAPEGLGTVLMWPNGTVVDTDDWAYLEAGDHFNWRLVLSASPGCIAGDYHLLAQIRMGDNSTMLFELGFRILRTCGLDLRAAESRRTCAPGSNVFFTLVCENTGNGPENVTLSLSGLPAGWPTPVFTVRDQDTGGRLALDPFGRALFAVELAVPPTAACGTVELGLTAYSHSASSEPVRLSIDVRLPNLVISKVQYSPHMLRLNREATITVTVRNTGDIAAENITVRFYDNNQTAGNDRLARLPAGSNLTVTFIWLPQGGSKELKFMADPDNVIIESNEQDNTARERIQMYRPPDYGEPPFELCLGPVALLGLVVAVLSVLRRKS